MTTNVLTTPAAADYLRPGAAIELLQHFIDTAMEDFGEAIVTRTELADAVRKLADEAKSQEFIRVGRGTFTGAQAADIAEGVCADWFTALS